MTGEYSTSGGVQTVPPDEETDPQGQRKSFEVRLTHLLFAIAMLAACINVFGGVGAIIAIYILSYWFVVHFAATSPAELITLTLILFGIAILMGPVYDSAYKDRARRAQSRGKLSQIGLALHNYHSVHGSFPPQCLRDADGKPTHSWRVLILPYAEQEKLYAKYNFDEPWDGPNNSKLHAERPAFLECPVIDSGEYGTSYVAIAGEATAWSDAGRKLSEFPNPSSSVMVIEHSGPAINWMEPRDVSLERVVATFSTPPDNEQGHWYSPGHFLREYDGSTALCADGGSSFLDSTTSKSSLRESFSLRSSIAPEAVETDESLRTVIVKWPLVVSVVLLCVLNLIPVLVAVLKLRDDQASKRVLKPGK